MARRADMKGWIVDCLKAKGGKGSPIEVMKYLWEHHESEIRASGDLLFSWQYDARWAAQNLRDAGVLKSVDGRRDLPWELT